MAGRLVLYSVFVFCVLITDGGLLIAQDFPYAVPQAPEFDLKGNLLPQGSQPAELPQNEDTAGPKSNKSEAFRSIKPFIPEAPEEDSSPARSHRPSVQGRQDGSATPQYRENPPQGRMGQPSAPTPSRNPAQTGNYRNQSPPPSPQNQERVDCSIFPGLIARAQSEIEMQMTAKQFLTCLMKSGLPLEQAKQYVISIIESSYRPQQR